MPELPEVETIRRQIAPVVSGQRVEYARATRDRAVRAHASPQDFVERIQGRTIREVNRRGKALVMPLDNGCGLLVRLGMSGKVVVADPDDPLAPHTHVVLGLSNGKELRYIDPRTFGEMAVTDACDPCDMVELAHYGYEPLSDEFTVEALRGLLSGKAACVEAVIMDQTKVVGVGKIYADESCFLAEIDPRRPAGSLDAEEAARLHAAIRDVLGRAIAARGTSSQDRAYRDASDAEGGFQHQLNVYQRAGLPCRRCGGTVEYRPFQKRRIHFCPRCQK